MTAQTQKPAMTFLIMRRNLSWPIWAEYVLSDSAFWIAFEMMLATSCTACMWRRRISWLLLDLALEVLKALCRLGVQGADLGRPNDPADLEKALALAAVELFQIGEVPRHERRCLHVERLFKTIQRFHQHGHLPLFD